MSEIGPATPGQTIGPFYGFALPYDGGANLVPGHHPDAIRLHGTVYDGHGVPVPDAMLEIWQNAPDGSVPQAAGSLLRDGYTFTGFGRCETDRAGAYSFTTLPPGAPFVSMVVFARGLLNRLFTRVYLPPAPEGDAVLQGLPEGRRATLVATEDGERSFRFDLHLQGDHETVFLVFPGQGE